MPKTTKLIAMLLLVLIPSISQAGKCTGKKNCKACKTCNSCKHCNSGGKCGVCSRNKK